MYIGLGYLTDMTSNIYQIIFENNPPYWLASRGVTSNSNYAGFSVYNIQTGQVAYEYLCNGIYNNVDEFNVSRAIRPIVYLKLNVQTEGKNENGEWTISE
ncbi:MAG: hypothetical protein HFJ27_00365 [Clostridia bacterium]|nr:hypothetical protein [Clostridia bacterium]